VVENGSGDNSAEIIAQAIASRGWGAWCSLLVSKKNLGFTGGNNIVIAKALQEEPPPQYFWLLNPDTVARPQALQALLEFMEHNPAAGIAGSRLEHPDGQPQRSAFRCKTIRGEFEANARTGPITRLLRRFVIAPPVVDHSTQTDWVSGASMIVRRQVFEQIGLLDEGYFTYFDDIDLCLVAQRGGWPTWYVPQSRVVHLVGQSTGVGASQRRQPAYMLEARRRFFLKNYSPLYALGVDIAMLLGLSIAKFRSFFKKSITFPPYMIRDSIRYSVLCKGFRVPRVLPPAKARI
jgi:GT2 family glycosyltransferase